MSFLFRILVATLGLAVGAGAAVPTTSPPIKDFSLPTFTDEGYRAMLIRGVEARIADASTVALQKMAVTLFAGDAAATVETTLTADTAQLDLDSQVVTGNDELHVRRADLSIDGHNWSYDHRSQKFHIKAGAKLVFSGGLTNLIQ